MNQDMLAELMRAQIEQLDGRMRERQEALGEKIEELRFAFETQSGAVFARLDAHEDYHRRNEHRWGLIRLAGLYPFRFAFLSVVFSMAAGSVSSQARLEILESLAKMIHWMAP